MSLTSLAKSIRKLAREAVGAKQPALAGLVGEWREVVGAEWALRCVPCAWKAGRGDRLATLELAVSGGTAPLVQHELPVLESRPPAMISRTDFSGNAAGLVSPA